MRTLLTEDQVCHLLHVSRDAMQRFRRDRLDPIPYLKAGRRYLYDEIEVLKWARRRAKREAERGGRRRWRA